MEAALHDRAPGTSSADPSATPSPLSAEELLRLTSFKLTYLAGAHLEQAALPADPDAARHLAFGAWLRHTGRLGGEFRRQAG